MSPPNSWCWLKYLLKPQIFNLTNSRWLSFVNPWANVSKLPNGECDSQSPHSELTRSSRWVRARRSVRIKGSPGIIGRRCQKARHPFRVSALQSQARTSPPTDMPRPTRKWGNDIIVCGCSWNTGHWWCMLVCFLSSGEESYTMDSQCKS